VAYLGPAFGNGKSSSRLDGTVGDAIAIADGVTHGAVEGDDNAASVNVSAATAGCSVEAVSTGSLTPPLATELDPKKLHPCQAHSAHSQLVVDDQ